jgi:hypothetical protein
MKNILKYCAVLTISLCFLTCTDSSDSEVCDAEGYALALNNLMEVRPIYIDNPTTENCNNYRFALQAYINSGANCDQFADLIQARQNELDNLNCN